MIFLHYLTIGFKLCLKNWTGNRTSNIFSHCEKGSKYSICTYTLSNFKNYKIWRDITCAACVFRFMSYMKGYIMFTLHLSHSCIAPVIQRMCCVMQLGSMKCYAQHSFQCMYKLHHSFDMRYANAGMFSHFRYLIWCLVYISVK